jgi:chemotaxis protein MotB
MQKQAEPEKLPDISSDIDEEPVDNEEAEILEQKLAKRYTAEFGPPGAERRQPTVFAVEDFSFRSSTPSPTHWSIGWSDLMMTMFILFLTLFVYQATHKKFLVSEQTEVVGGETTKAVEIAPKNTATAHFAAIKPSLPLITSGTIKKVIPVHIEDIGADTKFFSDQDKERLERTQRGSAPSGQMEKQQNRQAEEAGEEAEMGFSIGRETTESKMPAREQKPPVNADKIHRLYGIIKDTISRYNLSKFASASLISDGKSILVVLTSDLFFDKDKAELTQNSKVSLQKIGYAIKAAPFMINIVGHTDNQQVHTNRFPSNWELSVARASSVARFFIEETEMNPNQFVVSGFSSYRPLYPNTTSHNRAANRRVDVIISNHYPEPVTAKNQEGR